MSKCVGKLESILKKYYGYLWKEFGHRVIFSDSFRSDEMCFVVLESPDCRVKISDERGYVNLFFGPLSAPLKWDDAGWYYLGNVLDFLEGKHPTLKETLARNKEIRALSPSENLAYWSARLRPMVPRIVDLFRDDKGAEIRRLDDYLKRQKGEIRRELDETGAAHRRP